MHGALTADGDACEKAMREGLALARATGVHTWTFQLLAYGYGGALSRNDLRAAGLRSNCSRCWPAPAVSTYASTGISRPGRPCCAAT